jgi:hypothetical protein
MPTLDQHYTVGPDVPSAPVSVEAIEATEPPPVYPQLPRLNSLDITQHTLDVEEQKQVPSHEAPNASESGRVRSEYEDVVIGSSVPEKGLSESDTGDPFLVVWKEFDKDNPRV